MSAAPKPEARQAPKERTSPKPAPGNSSSAPAERPPRHRDGGERREGGQRPERREGGQRPERREGGQRPERREGGQRPERREGGQRPERSERPRRPQAGPAAAAAERSKPVAEEKTHGPVVHVKGDIASGATWARNGSGPSFADMVRQRASAAAANRSAKETPSPAQEAVRTPTPTPTPPPPPAQEPEPQPAESVPEPMAEPVSEPQPEPAPQPEPEESEEEEVVITTAQAPVMVEMEPIPEPTMPALPVIAPHYVLEIERVAPVKLPPRVTQTAETQRGLYMFSAKAGKPPTPPPTVQPQTQHALYRPDTANLGSRPWSLGTDSRIQQPPQQQAWPTASQFDYWGNGSERAPASRPFMGAQTQAPYNSYPTTAPLAHQRLGGNTFPARFRSSEATESALRQQPSAPFNRASPAANGGGVW